jgi:hypothetical protein
VPRTSWYPPDHLDLIEGTLNGMNHHLCCLMA